MGNDNAYIFALDFADRRKNFKTHVILMNLIRRIPKILKGIFNK